MIQSINQLQVSIRKHDINVQYLYDKTLNLQSLKSTFLTPQLATIPKLYKYFGNSLQPKLFLTVKVSPCHVRILKSVIRCFTH